jgi:TusA-related sulfurtransferase
VTQTIDHFLDITAYVCPMTFVKTKLLAEKMAVGEVAEVRLNAGEPLENVPRSLREEGHEVLSLEPEAAAAAAGAKSVHILRFRRC